MLGRVDGIREVLDSSDISGIQTGTIRTKRSGDRISLDHLDVGFIQAGRTDANAGRIQLTCQILVAEQFTDSDIRTIYSLKHLISPIQNDLGTWSYLDILHVRQGNVACCNILKK